MTAPAQIEERVGERPAGVTRAALGGEAALGGQARWRHAGGKRAKTPEGGAKPAHGEGFPGSPQRFIRTIAKPTAKEAGEPRI